MKRFHINIGASVFSQILHHLGPFFSAESDSWASTLPQAHLHDTFKSLAVTCRAAGAVEFSAPDLQALHTLLGPPGSRLLRPQLLQVAQVPMVRTRIPDVRLSQHLTGNTPGLWAGLLGQSWRSPLSPMAAAPRAQEGCMSSPPAPSP